MFELLRMSLRDLWAILAIKPFDEEAYRRADTNRIFIGSAGGTNGPLKAKRGIKG